jgi:DNA phosphorothioation-dependent restriction protein DptG
MKFNILDLLLPRETKFFDYLNQMSDLIVSSSNALNDLVVHIEGLSEDEIKKRLYAIRDYEQKGDSVEEIIIEELGRTFITPLDREDIHTLAMNMDLVLDILKGVSRKIEFYNMRKMPLNICKFSEIIASSAKLQSDLVHELHSRKQVRKKVDSLHHLEKQADDLFHNCMADLFGKDDNYQTIEMTKLKELYELLEEVVDSIDFVGKLVRGIKMKHG